MGVTTPQAAADVIAADIKASEPALSQFATDAAQGKVELTTLKSAVNETRRGWRTTEFWSAIVAAILDVATQIPFHDKLVVSGVAAVYAVARGLAKNGVPDIS